MAAIILPHKWLAPPQVPCGINENHWLVGQPGGFVFAPTTTRAFMSADPAHAQFEMPQTNSANTEARFHPTRGIRLYADQGGNNDDRLRTTTQTYPNAAGRALTSLVVFTPLSQNGVYGTIFRGGFATYNTGHYLFLNDSDDSARGGFFGGNGFNYYGRIGSKTYKEGSQSVVGISTRVAEIAVNFDGESGLSGTSGSISYVGAASGVAISDPCQPMIYEADYTHYYHFNGWIGLWVHAPNVYADAGGLQSLNENPWQVLAPLKRRLYFFATGAALAFEQEGFRWRYDDGDEDGATFSAAQDEHSAASIGIKKRLRALVNVTGTPSTEEFELQYRRVGSPSEDWRKVN